METKNGIIYASLKELDEIETRRVLEGLASEVLRQHGIMMSPDETKTAIDVAKKYELLTIQDPVTQIATVGVNKIRRMTGNGSFA